MRASGFLETPHTPLADARVPLISSSSSSSQPPTAASSSMSNIVPVPPPPPSTSSSPRRLSKSELTVDQMNIVLANLAAEERATLHGAGLGKQTWSRYLVETYFSKYGWYNPNKDDPDAPSLLKGWAYFEHFTLPRRYTSTVGGHQTRAPPGEKPKETKLYAVVSTPQTSLSDWGIGMGMYFSSLKATFFIFILAGSLNLYNILYYSNHVVGEYDPGEGTASFTMKRLLRYSMVCTDREWVVCAEPDGAGKCSDESNRWERASLSSYYGTATDDDGKGVTLISRTTCLPAQFDQGMINYGTLLLLIVCMSLFSWYMRKREVRFDEDTTSATDYTIVVRNPPPDAVDPDEWRDFFEPFAETNVTLCTVALNNEKLLAKLVQRRKDIRTLRCRLPPGVEVDFNDEQAVDAAVQDAKSRREADEMKRNCVSKSLSCIFVPPLRCLGLVPTETVVSERIKNTTEKIRELQKQEYKAAAVFVTFETEQGQRTALEALNASELEIVTNTAINLDSSSLFRERVLRAEEACEPNAVRWADLDFFSPSMYLQQLITLSITAGLVLLSAYILNNCIRVGPIFYSVILSVFNILIPTVVRILVSYERHWDEGFMQKSLYVKVTLFRWVNTAIITRLITPFLVTIGPDEKDLINTVNILMISEMIVSPLLRYLDFNSIVMRHFFAPRAKTEEELYGCFSGGYYNLAERFTDFTKVLLLCTFYSAFNPLIYFLGAGVLFTQYWTDKFLLLRSWQKAPSVGPETSRFSRNYFTSLALLLGAMSSAYAYFGSPFTMLCTCGPPNNKECTLGTTTFTNVEMLNGTTSPEVQTISEAFYFCNQGIIVFPPTLANQGPDKWMTDSQAKLTTVYGVTCFILLILYCVVVLGHKTVRAVTSLVKGVYEPRGFNQNKDFSSGVGLESFGYIPQLEVKGFHFPLVICNIDDIDIRLMGWKDPDAHNEACPHRNYDNHNLIFDVPHETLQRSRNVAVDESGPTREKRKVGQIFSVVKHYPPEWARRARENQSLNT